MNDSYERMLPIVMKYAKENRDNVQPSAAILEHYAVDSLDFVEAIYELEAEFGVSIPDESLKTVTSLKDLSLVLDELRNEA